MRNVIVSALVVALLAAGVCVFSIRTVEETCAQMERLRAEAVHLSRSGQAEQAIERTARMQRYWQQRSGVLTAILPHGAVAEITGVLLEGRADLTAGEWDEFEGDMLMLEELLRRLENDERLLLSNILSIC